MLEHHRALHEGKLQITGSPPNLTIAYLNQPASSPLAISPAIDPIDPIDLIETLAAGTHPFEWLTIVTSEPAGAAING